MRGITEEKASQDAQVSQDTQKPSSLDLIRKYITKKNEQRKKIRSDPQSSRCDRIKACLIQKSDYSLFKKFMFQLLQQDSIMYDEVVREGQIQYDYNQIVCKLNVKGSSLGTPQPDEKQYQSFLRLSQNSADIGALIESLCKNDAYLQFTFSKQYQNSDNIPRAEPLSSGVQQDIPKYTSFRYYINNGNMWKQEDLTSQQREIISESRKTITNNIHGQTLKNSEDQINDRIIFVLLFWITFGVILKDPPQEWNVTLISLSSILQEAIEKMTSNMRCVKIVKLNDSILNML